MMPSLLSKNETLSNVDAAWLGMEDPTNLMMVSGILVLDGIVDFERLKATLEYRLLPYKRFRQRVIEGTGPLGKPYWEEDPNFDLASHLRRVALPDPGDKEALQAMVSDLMSTPLDYSKPLWRMHLIENYQEGSVLMGRFHHCIADGIAMIFVLLSMTDADSTAPWPVPPEDKKKRGSRNPISYIFNSVKSAASKTAYLTEKLIHEGMETLAHPSRVLDLAKLGTDAATATGRLFLRFPDAKTIFKGKLGVYKRAVWSEAIPLIDVKAIGKVTKGTVNDVLLTAMTGALRRYLEQRDEPIEGLNFRAAVPVNLRPLEEAHKLGNQFGLVFLSLPVGLIDPLDRLMELKRRMSDLKGTPEAIVSLGILGAIGMTPHEIQNIIVHLFGTKATTVMTNVPGPRETIYLAGAPVKDLMFWVPQAGRVSMGISIISYAGKVRLGVATDVGLIPDPETITLAFHDEFADLMELVHQAQQEEAKDLLTKPKMLQTPSTQSCQGQTKQGKPCKNKAQIGSAFCHIHQPN